MSSSTIDKAASNGTDTNAMSRPRRVSMASRRVREQVIYSLTGTRRIRSLRGRAPRARRSRRPSRQRILDHDGSKGTEPVDTAQIAKVIAEALDCIDVAAEYLSRLSTDIRTRQPTKSRSDLKARRAWRTLIPPARPAT